MLQKKIVNFFLLLIVFFGCSRALLNDVPVVSEAAIAKTIKSLEIYPPNMTVEIGNEAQFHAMVIFSDGSNEIVNLGVDWTSLYPSISTVNTNADDGKAMGVSRGVSIIEANYQGWTAQAVLTVTNSTITAIEVNPMNEVITVGVNQSYIATAIYGDNTKADVTSQVTWSSLDSTIAPIRNDSSQKGHATGQLAGTTTITATLGVVVGSTGLEVKSVGVSSLAITPAVSTIPKASNVDYIATATFNDGTSKDVTGSVVWASMDPSVATITAGGKATGVTVGQAFIKATLNGVSNQVILNVTAATLDSLEITPANSSGIIGIQHRFRLTGTYSDGSTQDLTSIATWTTSDMLKLLISDLGGLKGYALALLSGGVTVSASIGNKVATTPFTVTPAVLISIQVNPSNLTLPLGLSQPLTAVGIFSDATVKDITQDVVWTVSDPSVATVSNAVGNVTNIVSNAVGTANAVASYGLVTGTSAITTTAATLTSIAISPTNVSNPLGIVQKFIATGTYSDGSTADVTHLANWSTSSPGILGISNASGYKGSTSSLGVGSGNVVATLDNAIDSTVATVTPKQLVAITVTPANGTLLLLGLKQFKAIGLYSDSTSEDITNTVTWSASSILGSINSSGLFFGVNPGILNVTATKNGVSRIVGITLGI